MKTKRATSSKNRTIASICRTSFYEFVQHFWETIISEKPIWNWHIKYLCDELQIVAERVFARKPKKYDLIINISPGTTKSTIASIMYPVWCWTRDLSIQTICASYALALSHRLSDRSKDVASSDKYLAVFPEIVLDDEAKSLLSNTKHGERYATSTNGTVTGMHGHIIVLDDPIKPQDADSTVVLESANTWIDQTLSPRKIDKEITPMILIMQRLHQNDPTAHMLGKGTRVKHICLPATKSSKIRPRKLRKFYKDGFMDPMRLGKRVLADSRKELGEYGYAGQHDQSPIAAGGNLFKFERLLIDTPPTHIKKVVRYWDKAGTEGGGCYTAGVKMAVDQNGRYWVLDVVRGQWAADSRESVIKQTAKLDGKKIPIVVEQEPGSAGKDVAEYSVRLLAGYNALAHRPTGDKTVRARPYASQVNAGNVSTAEGNWVKDYKEEMQYFPNSKYKDQIDASSGAFMHLVRKRKFVGAIR